MTDINEIKNLIKYAKERLELKERDSEYKSNRLLEIMRSGLEGTELEDAVYGELSLLPSEIDERFSVILKENGSKAATEWLYNYCVSNKYVKKDVLDKNPEYHAIKKESIGLIEAQGLFILPGRLEEQLCEIEKIIKDQKPLPTELDEFKLVYNETQSG